MKKTIRVAIQGVRASFHDVVAEKYFRSFNVVPVECKTFKELCEVLKKGKADFALMAIENSIAGSILTNYTLLENYKFSVIGEIYNRIELYLMARKGESLKSIKQVISHPMALAQCTGFLNKISGIRIVETNDTAESAMEIRDKKLKNVAAVASKMAARVYGLKILASHIENDKRNFTRFFVISNKKSLPIKNANKVSIRVELPNEPGSLLAALKVINDYKVNMTKIQSVPIVGKPKQYGFHIDLEIKSRSQLNSLLSKLKTQTRRLSVLGVYKSAILPV